MALARPTPKTGSWTYEDLLALPDDGKRYEIIEGELYEVSGATTRHGGTIINLIALLAPFVQALRGRLHTAPTDVFFPAANPVQPDLLVVLPGGSTYRAERGIEGIPDLIVDVLSPSTRTHDTVVKRALYERVGLREYWLADPAAETVEVLVLEDGSFRRLGVFAGDARIESTVFPGVSFAVADVFADFEDIRPSPR